MCRLTRQKSRFSFRILLYGRIRCGSRNRLTLVVLPSSLIKQCIALCICYTALRTLAFLGFLTSPCACISGSLPWDFHRIAHFCYLPTGKPISQHFSVCQTSIILTVCLHYSTIRHMSRFCGTGNRFCKSNETILDVFPLLMSGVSSFILLLFTLHTYIK